MTLHIGTGLARRMTRGWIGFVAFALSLAAGISPPFPAQASVQLQGFGVTPPGPGTHTSTSATTLGTPATPPAPDQEPLPSADVYSDSVGATPATYRTDESGAATYSVSLYAPPGTAGLVPALSLQYNSRGANGPMGPGFSLGGLSAISRCKKATEYGDGAGPFPSVNFDGVAADQAYCLDGARLLDLNSGAGNCPAGQSGDTAHVFGLELDPATRVCGYAKTGITGYAYWLAQPKDGSYRVYGTGGNSALVHNDGQGNPDATQYFSWALNRIADTTGNTVEFSYTQNTATGEMDVAEVDYTGKIAMTDVLKSAPAFTRTPYAKVVFSYAAIPAASQRIDYVSGMKLALTQQLTTITVSGPSNINGDTTTSQVARTYHLRYGTPTSSGLSALTSLQECVPNGSGEVCYPSTRFTWDNVRGSTPGYPNAPSTQSYSGLQYAIDYKVGDVDGDGRQDLVWVKDQSCDSTGSGATRFQIYVSRATGTGFATAVATGVYLSRPPQTGQGALPGCGADWRSFHFDSLWYLYDFSGDGRDDLLAANGSSWNGTSWTNMTWKIYPAIASGTDYTFDHSNPVATGMASWPSDDGLFLDENGDGLPDLMDSTTQYIITSHLLQKQPSGALTFNFSTTATSVLFTTPIFGGSTSSPELGFSTGAGRDVLNADLNGDGAADMVLKVTQDTCGSGGAAPAAQTTQPTFSPSSMPASPSCHTRWYTFRNDGIQADGLHMTYETFIGDTLTVPDDGSYINLVDLNGDGQTDLVYTKLASGNYTYYYRLNAGKSGDAAATERFLPEQSTGLTLSTNYAERVQFLDVNGDHQIDLVYWDGVADGSGTYPLKAKLWSTAGFGSPVDVGNSTLNAKNPLSTQSFLMDVNGDGGPDMVTFASGTLSVFGYGPTFGGNDFVTDIVNGLGAFTGLTYYPLAYTSGYTRAYDGPGKTWGRGSPVFDVFSAIWVVHEASSSAPLAGQSLLTGSASSVVYRYSGAKIQAGGRGFLGFATVQAENQQPTQDTSNYLVTTTEYRQDFPYIGRPDHTVVELESALQPDPCVSAPGDSCFVHNPPPCGSGGVICNIAQTQSLASIGVGGQVLSDAADTYTSTPAFAPGTVQPLLPYLSSSDEQKFDVTTSGALSHEVTSSFTDDSYGNVTSSSVLSSEASGTDETKTTSNIYGCTVAPPTKNCSTLNTEWQRLGRLSVSTVTSSRPGQTNNVRRASFEYDPTTLLRIADIQGPYDSTDEPNVNVLKTLGLRTDLVRDADGNVTEQVQCSTYHFANRAACTNLSAFQQRQWQSDPTKIQRYAKWNYESLGRFELYKLVPFYSATGTGNTDENIAEYVGIAISGGSMAKAFTPQAILPVVVNRDVFGNPANKVSSAGDQWSMAYGMLGRAHFAEDVTTGSFSRTTYAWCQDVVNSDIPSAAPRANCPIGAVYRVTTDSSASGTYAGTDAAPMAWAYYDVLGREMLRTKRIYQPDPNGNPSKLHWSSVATTYDSTGRTATVSTPYFSIDPATTQTGLATSRAGTLQTGADAPGTATTTYDAVDRGATQTHPEEPANTPSSSSWSYAELTTDAKNPRGYTTRQVKNARDEAMQVVAPVGQANALTVNYERDAVGNLTYIKRTPGDGDSAGHLIQTQMFYDRLGRKTGMTDPDKGGWTYSYNALGEPVSQVDAKGQTQNQYRDALGRVYLRTETRASGNGFVSEPASAWEFDTATRSDSSTILGPLHIESNGIGGFTRTTEYNDYGRVDHSVTQMDGTTYTERQTWDQFGRPFQHFDPSTSPTSPNGELTQYSADGYPIVTREAANGLTDQIYNEVLGLSQRGQVNDERFHGNAALETTRDFDPNTGRALEIVTAGGTLQDWSYEYDKHSNVVSRWNHANGYDLKETLAYDNLDRLHTLTLTANGTTLPTITSSYDQIGNPTTRTQGAVTQTWHYGGGAGCAAGPHAVSSFGSATYCYDANGNQITANYGGGQTRSIVYTGYDLPAQISTNGTPSNATESFAYAPDRSMFKRVEGVSGGTSDSIFCNGFDTTTNTCPNTANTPTTYYVGNVEIRSSGSTTTTKRYIGGYLVITTTNTNPTPAYAYLFRDALGSIDVITNELAQVTQRQSFDAWGNRRDASPTGQWGLLPPATAASFDTTTTFQGYTGHQQLDPVGLVHMKGRLYDPVLGRFIQADPMTEGDPTQGLNRYSYVLNNPLSLTDPSGYLSFRQILGIAIAVVAACFGQWEISQGMLGWAFATAVAGGFLSGYVATGSLRAGLWGAFAAGVFFGIGAYFQEAQWAHDTGMACSSGLNTGAQFANVAVHGAGGGILATMQGGNFGSGFVTAGATEALSPAINSISSAPARIMTASVLGGTISEATGNRFASGAETAFFQGLFTAAATPIATAQGRQLTGKAAAAEQAAANAYSCNDGGMLTSIGIKYEPTDGFSACLTQDSDGQYILAIRGTDGFDDIPHAWTESVGVNSSQYQQALTLGDAVYSATSRNVLFTGHSAGGGMAAAIAAEVGGDAITFNAQGYTPPAGSQSGSIYNFYVPGDILTSAQSVLPIPAAMGYQIAYPPSSFFESPLARHSLSNFGSPP